MTLDEKLNSDQWPVQCILHWYRFGKLVRLNCRKDTQIPLVFGWIFETYEYVLDIELPSDARFDQWRHKLAMYRRWIDPWLLPVARFILRFVFKPDYDHELLWDDMKNGKGQAMPKDV